MLQIETLPEHVEDDGPAHLAGAELMLPGGERINRAAAEKLCLDLLEFVDHTGLTEGPRWPSIAVTPLALYRTVEPRRGGEALRDVNST